jgi:hypothetical protein
MTALARDNFSELEIASIISVKEKIYNDFGGLLGMMPRNLQNLILTAGNITGGCVASIFHSKQPNDWDVYLETEEAIKEFDSMIKNDGPVRRVIADANPNYREFETTGGKVITENAVTFENGIQVITRATADVARNHFDFIHCMPYYKLSDKKFFISRKQFEAIRDKRIVMNPNYRGNVKFARVDKYKERGWVGP